MLMSYWMNRDKLGPALVEPIDRLTCLAKRFDSFKDFMIAYLDDHCGLVKEIRQFYPADFAADTDCIGRDLANIFCDIGVQFDSDVLRRYPKANETADKPRWPKGMKKRVLEAEA